MNIATYVPPGQDSSDPPEKKGNSYLTQENC